MADRGEVLRLKRRLGFAPKGETDAVVVVQSNRLNAILPSLIVVPLDAAVGAYAGLSLAIRVSREEAGSHVDHVAVPWSLRYINADVLAPGPVGRLRPDTLRALEQSIRLVLDLP
jgi:mRNA-degrading endonuclease toxin of MazEF toxin-antitoxin module